MGLSVLRWEFPQDPPIHAGKKQKKLKQVVGGVGGHPSRSWSSSSIHWIWRSTMMNDVPVAQRVFRPKLGCKDVPGWCPEARKTSKNPCDPQLLEGEFNMTEYEMICISSMYIWWFIPLSHGFKYTYYDLSCFFLSLGGKKCQPTHSNKIMVANSYPFKRCLELLHFPNKSFRLTQRLDLFHLEGLDWRFRKGFRGWSCMEAPGFWSEKARHMLNDSATKK